MSATSRLTGLDASDLLDRVIVTYDWPRRLCAVARGIATHFGETIEIWEPTCMHRGEPACTLSFRVARASAE